MPLRAIAYRSNAVQGVTADQLKALVRNAAHHNRLAGVTGVLLCDGSHFLQYIEGPEDGIEQVYSRVLSSRSHTGVVELARGEAQVRRFPHWSMHWIPVEEHALHAAAVADWTSVSRSRSASESQSSGVARLAALVEPHLPPGRPTGPRAADDAS